MPYSTLSLSTYWLGGCGGCRLSRTDARIWLREAADHFEITKRPWDGTEQGPVDITLLEGAVAGQAELPLLRRIRENSRIVIAIGDCALEGNLTQRRPAASTPTLRPPDKLPVETVIAIDIRIPGCTPSLDMVRTVLLELAAGASPDDVTASLRRAAS